MTVTQVIIHPKYIEASSSGYDIAIYKAGGLNILIFALCLLSWLLCI